MESKTVTISDVARDAGVSLGTVSRVLNGKDGKIKISEKTRVRVLDAAAALGYRPNPFASALRGSRTGIIGVVIRDIGEAFPSKLLRDVQRECQNRGMEVLIGHAEYDLTTARRQVDLMLNHLFDGLIILGNMPGDESLLHMIEQRNIPAVLVVSKNVANLPSVTFDNALGTRLACRHLQSLGHPRIAVVANDGHAGVVERIRTFRAFVKRRRLYCPEEYVRLGAKTTSDAVNETKFLLQLPTPPTAIFCTSDLLAIGCMSGVWQSGLQVPQDISVLGYDDIDEAKSAYSPLSTIRQPTDLAARQTVSLLMDMILEPERNGKSEKVVIKPELVVRFSCAPFTGR